MLQLRVAACACMLILGSYSDWKSREVGDKIWVAFSIMGVVFTVGEVFLTSEAPALIPFAVSIILTGGISVGLYYVGFFGGADAKALIAASMLLPLYFPYRYIHPISPIIILTNSAFLTLVLPVIFAVSNMVRLLRKEALFQGFESEPWRRKVAAFFLGYRTKRAGKFLFPLEKTVEGKRVFDISLLRGDVMFMDEADRWVTPGIPLIVYMLAGFFVMILYGDIVAVVLNWIFRG